MYGAKCLFMSGPTVLESDIMSYIQKTAFLETFSRMEYNSAPFFVCKVATRDFFSWVGLEGNI